MPLVPPLSPDLFYTAALAAVTMSEIMPTHDSAVTGR
jgi:hypothetical protein